MLDELVTFGLGVLVVWWLVFVCFILYTGWFSRSEDETESMQAVPVAPVHTDTPVLTSASAE